MKNFDTEIYDNEKLLRDKNNSEFSSAVVSFDIEEPSKEKPKVLCSSLLICVFTIILIVNASYAIFAPFMPMLSENHGVENDWLGIMFCIYSIAMVISSPIVGKYQNKIGRRYMTQFGLAILSISFLGFYFINLVSNKSLFIAGFIFLRILQGVGTSMCQTSLFAILIISYPNHIDFVISWLETAAGLGLSVGPVIGTILYSFGGIEIPFLIFSIITATLGFTIDGVIPQDADSIQEEVKEAPKVSYTFFLKNIRILFANLCVFLSVLQFTFIDPTLAHYLHNNFGISYQNSGYFFLALGVGFTASCFLVNIALRILSNKHAWMIACVLLGLLTMFYGESYVLQLPPNLAVLAVGLFFAGVFNAYLVIPTMKEMIEASKEELNLDEKDESLNDMCSGLFNMFFAAGEICGPLLGNFIYTQTDFATTWDSFGLLLIAFGVAYFLVIRFRKVSN